MALEAFFFHAALGGSVPDIQTLAETISLRQEICRVRLPDTTMLPLRE